MASILDTITTIARENLDYEGTVTSDKRLVEDLALDSLQLLSLAVAVEDHYRICLDEDDEAHIDTVGDLVALIEAKIAALDQA
ncbi:MAG: acyl carrier protein [Acidobacteriota bacterium]